jgi:AcrR family transcriptional regulator
MAERNNELNAGSATEAPRARDSDRSQQAILSAAVAEFAQYGLGGARMERIAERAGVDKRLIYYYFDNKDSLFLAVLEETYKRIRVAESDLRLTDLEPVEAVRRLTEFTWKYHVEHPEFVTLLNSENLHGARHLRESKHIRQMNSPLILMLGDILERGRIQGVFRGGVDPVQLYISIAGLAYFYVSNHATLSAIFGRNLMAPKALNERLSHVLDVVLGYLMRD